MTFGVSIPNIDLANIFGSWSTRNRFSSCLNEHCIHKQECQKICQTAGAKYSIECSAFNQFNLHKDSLCFVFL